MTANNRLLTTLPAIKEDQTSLVIDGTKYNVQLLPPEDYEESNRKRREELKRRKRSKHRPSNTEADLSTLERIKARKRKRHLIDVEAYQLSHGQKLLKMKADTSRMRYMRGIQPDLDAFALKFGAAALMIHAQVMTPGSYVDRIDVFDFDLAS